MRRRRLALDGSRAPARGVAAIAIGGGGVVAAADAGRAAGAVTVAAIQAEVAEADGKSGCWLRGGSFQGKGRGRIGFTSLSVWPANSMSCWAADGKVLSAITLRTAMTSGALSRFAAMRTSRMMRA